jgi:hypothetical protein
MSTIKSTKLASLGRAAAAKTLAPLLSLVVLSGLAFSATPAMAEFGLSRFAIGAQNGEGQNGTPDLQAGSHPYSLTNTFVLNDPGPVNGYLKDVHLQLPPGFVGDPTATPRCTYQEFSAELEGGSGKCSKETAVGLSITYLGDAHQPGEFEATTDPVYNLVPPRGVAADRVYRQR